MKIAISGKMCSGKSFITNLLIKHFEKENKYFKKLSFADDVYKIARELFNMKTKNRQLLQSIGTKMREIDPDIWTKSTTLRTQNHKFVIIDDLRFPNELHYLKQNNFTLIRLNISKKEQIKRLKETYPDTFKQHLENLNHQSETSFDNISNDKFDILFNINDNINSEIIAEEIIQFLKLKKLFNS